jgi:hypothetical protein
VILALQLYYIVIWTSVAKFSARIEVPCGDIVKPPDDSLKTRHYNNIYVMLAIFNEKASCRVGNRSEDDIINESISTFHLKILFFENCCVGG